ncbi:two-component system, chemotaxis family, sensor kinase CheA [Clostridium cavendishii DSM 21758]|uniref:Chemotaxis protein CheA n=1 Tax=Clostridium cavendishii DSM 21758 TaxID=1121302 RepID=A0A1M6B5Y7_9CLOT|nr:chemotaxis protein CheA [Clostridium cavendishii]SHI43883.1 two-component system, chemotaxis family, sensor kinase CheA [Clostridium cavendishii DSM 21758]
MDTSQYLSMFLEESIDNLQTLNEALLYLEQQPEDVDKLNEIFRVAHTIKGMAATMGFNEMAELTHKMEDVLSKFREGELKVTQSVVTVLFDCLDTLEKMVNNISEGVEDSIEITNIISALEGVASGEKEEVKEEVTLGNKDIDNNFSLLKLNQYDISVIKQAKDKGYRALSASIELSPNTLLKSARAFLIFKEIEDIGEIIKSYPTTEDIEGENFDFALEIVVLTQLTVDELKNIIVNISEVNKVLVSEVDVNNEDDNSNKQKAPEITKNVKQEEKVKKVEPKEAVQPVRQKPVVKEHKKAHQSVRVDLDRLDKLMNMVSELVIHRTRLEQISSQYRSTDLNETLEQVARTTSDLQDLVMKIRMLPLDIVFNRFPRMIRDLSVELNKEINFIIEGQDTELDRTVIDEIGEPLIHLLRNAADHGVESAEDRVENGKTPVGTIKLTAYQEGTKAVIKVEDDGAGVNVEKVKAKAERVGISTEGMSDDEIKNLIFSQGFSTNEVVTDISGRGVGMDVVKTKIAALGGTVDLVSELGKGSAFIIKLPLTLQIIQALLVNVAEETFAISLGFIDRVIDYNEERIKKTNGKEVIVYRENVIPLVRLRERLNIGGERTGKNFIIIVKVGNKEVGILVDSLLGQQEVVIKPLGKTLQGSKEYIGATILGNGLVTLILDIAALI